MPRPIVLALLLPVLLAGCGRAIPHPQSAPHPGAVPPSKPAPPRRPPPDAQILRAPGLEGVIGADASSLLRQFGEARLDVHEGDVRKLQFSGRACVLDVYLYPPKGGGEPTTTYVDARRASDGQDVDRGACVAALRRR